MTHEQLKERKSNLEMRRMALVDQITDADVASANVSEAGGSQSYSNRSVDDLKKKVAFIDKEIARIDARLGLRASPNAIGILEPRYS